MKFMAYVIDMLGRAFIANICLALQFKDNGNDTPLFKKFTQSM